MSDPSLRYDGPQWAAIEAFHEALQELKELEPNMSVQARNRCAVRAQIAIVRPIVA